MINEARKSSTSPKALLAVVLMKRENTSIFAASNLLLSPIKRSLILPLRSDGSDQKMSL